jgi:hypothetical protein
VGPLGVRERPHRVQPQSSVRHRTSCRPQGPGGPPSGAFRSAPRSARVAYLERDGVARDDEKGCAPRTAPTPWPSRDAASATGIISASSLRRRMPPR